MDTLSPAKPRAKWGVRAEVPAPITITPRDLTLLAHLASLRFLAPEQLGKLDGGSEQNVTRCLRALFDHGYVDQVGDPFVRRAYAITRKGTNLLKEHGHLVDPTVRWSLKNKRAGGRFIDHTLGIADVLVGMHVACRDRRDVSLMLEPKIIANAPEATRKAREPLRWTVAGAKEKFGVSSVVADGLFGLRFANDTAAYFLLELDRGHMPNTSPSASPTDRYTQGSPTCSLPSWWCPVPRAFAGETQNEQGGREDERRFAQEQENVTNHRAHLQPRAAAWCDTARSHRPSNL